MDGPVDFGDYLEQERARLAAAAAIAGEQTALQAVQHARLRDELATNLERTRVAFYLARTLGPVAAQHRIAPNVTLGHHHNNRVFNRQSVGRFIPDISGWSIYQGTRHPTGDPDSQSADHRVRQQGLMLLGDGTLGEYSAVISNYYYDQGQPKQLATESFHVVDGRTSVAHPDDALRGLATFAIANGFDQFLQ